MSAAMKSCIGCQPRAKRPWFYLAKNIYGMLCQESVKNIHGMLSAVPNLDIAFRIFLTIMFTNSTTERCLPQLKRVKKQQRLVLLQKRLHSFGIFNR